MFTRRQFLTHTLKGYPDPVPENPKIRDLICFYNERVDLVVDGEPIFESAVSSSKSSRWRRWRRS